MKWKKLVNESIEMEQLMEELRDWLIEETESGNIGGYYIKDYDVDRNDIFVHLRMDRLRKNGDGVDGEARIKEYIKKVLGESIVRFCSRNNYSPYLFSVYGETAKCYDWDFLVIEADMRKLG